MLVSPNPSRHVLWNACAASARWRRRGFTFVELSLAMAIMAIVLAAAASFLFAVGTQWRHSEDTQATTLRAARVTAVLREKVRSSLAVGAYRPGAPGAPAAVLLWIVDGKPTDASSPDNLKQAGELAVLHFVPSSNAGQPGEIRWCTDSIGAGKGADVTSTFADSGSANWQSILAYASSNPGTLLASQVWDMKVNVINPGAGEARVERPLVTISVELGDGETTEVREIPITVEFPK